MTEVEAGWNRLQYALIRRLADGLVESVSAVGVNAETTALGVCLLIDGDQINIGLGAPVWDASRRPTENILASAQAAFGLVQSELAKAAAEPWPRHASRISGVRGLPRLELELAENVLFIRYRAGPELIELKPIDFDIDLEAWETRWEREGRGISIDLDLIGRAADSWLQSRTAGEVPKEWVESLITEWATIGPFERLWRLVLRLCEMVDPMNKEIVDLIGVDPLVSLMLGYPDQTLQAIEDVADQQPTVVDALSVVMGNTKELDARIDAVLARCGRPRG